MKPINQQHKHKVIKLFLEGTSFDEIAAKVMVSKGSVVNIVEEFKCGMLSPEGNMTEYVDCLRHVAVDLRKHDITVGQAKACITIHAKLEDMGVKPEQAEAWLDASSAIASKSPSSQQFVQSALELASLESETGLTYQQTVDDYKVRTKARNDLNTEIEHGKGALEQLQKEHGQAKAQANAELNSIMAAIKAAQLHFVEEKERLKAGLDDYMEQHGLSWHRVKVANALLDSAGGKSGLGKKERDDLAARIVEAGSLAVAIAELKKQKSALLAEVEGITSDKTGLLEETGQLRQEKVDLSGQLNRASAQIEQLESEIGSKREEHEKLGRIVNILKDLISETRVILGFLVNPEVLSDRDFDHLASLVMGVRAVRLGTGPKVARDSSGKVICACQVPHTLSLVLPGDINVDTARRSLALHLEPLVRDKFVSVYEHEMGKTEYASSIIDQISPAAGKALPPDK